VAGEPALAALARLAASALNDVVDVDHQPGTIDSSFRPNQVLALGGLPLVLVDAMRARRALDAIEARLWTPLGLRSLASGERGYIGHYRGGVFARDTAYHQGAVWPWLLTPFVEAWVRARQDDCRHRRSASALSPADRDAPGRRRAGPCVGDRRRRRASQAKWLPIPGLVGRRGSQARSNRPRSSRKT
jgi:glycogen debranching enzyme